MSLPRHRLEEASFWDFAVCLDCQGLFDQALLEQAHVCPACNSQRLFPAEIILACADFVEDEDE